MRYHLELLYSDEAHVCNVEDRGYVNPTNKQTIFRTTVDLNLEQIMSMLMFLPD